MRSSPGLFVHKGKKLAFLRPRLCYSSSKDSVVTEMASSKLRAGPEPDRREVPLAVASNAGSAPLDALYEILLRLPGKELCRLRALCRSCRSLLFDPLFAAPHSARHREPLIVAGYAEDMNNGILFDIIDLSGHVVSRVHGTANATGYERVVSTHSLISSASRRGPAGDEEWSTRVSELSVPCLKDWQ